jgi:hypothetical protein
LINLLNFVVRPSFCANVPIEEIDECVAKLNASAKHDWQMHVPDDCNEFARLMDDVHQAAVAAHEETSLLLENVAEALRESTYPLDLTSIEKRLKTSIDAIEWLDRIFTKLRSHWFKAIPTIDSVVPQILRKCQGAVRDVFQLFNRSLDSAVYRPVLESDQTLSLAVIWNEKAVAFESDWPRLKDRLEIESFKAEAYADSQMEKRAREAMGVSEVPRSDSSNEPENRETAAISTENKTEDKSVDEISVGTLQEGSLVLDDTLLGILKALNGRALRVQQIADEVTAGETTSLYRAGLKTKLEKNGLIVRDPKIGWYRPDRPPIERVVKVTKSSAKK